MKGLLSKLDFFGENFYLNMDRHLKYKSVVGGIISILLFAGTLCVTYYFGKDIYYKQEPTLSSYSQQLPNYPYVKIDKSNFFFGINVLNNSNTKQILTNKKYLDFKVKYHGMMLNTTTGNITAFAQTFDMDQCNLENADPLSMIQNNLNNFNCIDLNMEIGGMNSFPLYKYLRYELKKCNKETEIKYNITCAPAAEIEKVVSNTQIGYMLNKQIITSKSFETPVVSSYNYDYEVVTAFYSENKYLQHSFYFHPSIIETDTGLVFDEITTSTSFLEFVENRKETRTKSATSLDLIYKANIYISNLETNYTRRYLKVPSLAAKVGGFFSCILPLIEIVYHLFQRNDYQVFLISKLLKLQLEVDDETSEQNNKSVIKEVEMEKFNADLNNSNNKLNVISNNNISNIIKIIFINVNINNLLHFVEQQEGSNSPNKNHSTKKKGIVLKKDVYLKNPELKEIINYKHKKRENITIPYSAIFKFEYCNCCKIDNKRKMGRKELIELANEEILKKMDIQNITKTPDKLNLLINLLLNENQKFMINNRETKVIINKLNEEENNKKDKEKSISEQKYMIKKEKLFKYITETIKTSSLIDIMLYKYLDSDLKDEIKEKLGIDL